MKKKPPPLTNKPLTNTPCKFWKEKGTCFKGKGCPFAHDGPMPGPPEATLIVRNVQAGVSRKEVKSYFMLYGRVASVKFSSPPRRDVFVEFYNAEDAQSAHERPTYFYDKLVTTECQLHENEASSSSVQPVACGKTKMPQPLPSTPSAEPQKAPPPSERERKNSEVITFYIQQLENRINILVHKHEKCTVEKEAMNRDMGSKCQQLEQQIFHSNQIIYTPNMEYEKEKQQQEQWMVHDELTKCKKELSAQTDRYKEQEAEVTKQMYECRNMISALKLLQTRGFVLENSPPILNQVRKLTGVKTMPSSSSNSSRSGNNVPNTGESGGGGSKQSPKPRVRWACTLVTVEREVRYHDPRPEQQYRPYQNQNTSTANKDKQPVARYCSTATVAEPATVAMAVRGGEEQELEMLPTELANSRWASW